MPELRPLKKIFSNGSKPDEKKTAGKNDGVYLCKDDSTGEILRCAKTSSGQFFPIALGKESN